MPWGALESGDQALETTYLASPKQYDEPPFEPLASPAASNAANKRIFPPATILPTAVKRAWVSELAQAPILRAALLVSVDFAGLGVVPALTRSNGRMPLIFMALIGVLLFQSKGMYRPHLNLSVLDDMPRLVPRSVAAALAVGVVVGVVGLRPTVGIFAVLAVVGIAAQLVLRALVYALLRQRRAAGLATQNCLIVGGGPISNELAKTLVDRPSYGLRVVGFLEDGQSRAAGERVAPLLGHTGDLRRVVAQKKAHTLIVAFGGFSDEELVESLREPELASCDIFIVPRLHEVYRLAGNNDHVGAIPVFRLRQARVGPITGALKRAFDVITSGLAVAVLSPVLFVIAVAVWLEGGRDVLFRQVRVGKDGRNFELLKFRSLKPVNDQESQTNWNVAHDDRLGPIGKFLRKTSLDELPQLWNILRGDMSVVGPRPERPHFVSLFSSEFPDYQYRHRMRCGLTGLAQVNGLRGDTSIADRVRYDNYYIQNWSLWLDVKIIVATIRAAAQGG